MLEKIKEKIKPSTLIYSLSLLLYIGLIWLMFCGFFIETTWWYL